MTLDPLCSDNIRQKRQFARLGVCLCRTAQSVLPEERSYTESGLSCTSSIAVTGKTPTFTKSTKGGESSRYQRGEGPKQVLHCKAT